MISESEFDDIMSYSLGIDVYDVNNGLLCPICGNKIYTTNYYYVNGVRRYTSTRYFICDNRENYHAYNYQTFLKMYLDNIEGCLRANENHITYSDETII